MLFRSLSGPLPTNNKGGASRGCVLVGPASLQPCASALHVLKTSTLQPLYPLVLCEFATGARDWTPQTDRSSWSPTRALIALINGRLHLSFPTLSSHILLRSRPIEPRILDTYPAELQPPRPRASPTWRPQPTRVTLLRSTTVSSLQPRGTGITWSTSLPFTGPAH